MSSVFGSGKISLKDINDAYGITSMAGLRGKEAWTIGLASQTTIPASGAIDMNTFRGKSTIYAPIKAVYGGCNRQTTAASDGTVKRLTINYEMYGTFAADGQSIEPWTLNFTDALVNGPTVTNRHTGIMGSAWEGGQNTGNSLTDFRLDMDATVAHGDPSSSLSFNAYYRISNGGIIHTVSIYNS